MSAARCRQEIVRIPLDELAHALGSGKYAELDEFVNRNSDGFGNPLPTEACTNLALAAACSKHLLPEYSHDLLSLRDKTNREQRARRQRLRRAAERLGESITKERCRYTHLAPHRNSTVHLVTGALIVRHWTGAAHHREQMEMLKIMGLHKGEDFIRDRIDYLRRKNPTTYENVQLLAAGLRSQKLRGVKPNNSRLLSPDFSL